MITGTCFDYLILLVPAYLYAVVDAQHTVYLEWKRIAALLDAETDT